MNKWLRSFYLHPFFNRFNMLFFTLWAGTGMFTDLPHVFLTGLGIEAAYIGVRTLIDRSRIPMFRMRRLPSAKKKKFLEIADKHARIEDLFENIAPNSALLDHSSDQARRLTRVYLELLLMDQRIELYLRSLRENYDQKIRELTEHLQTAQGEMRSLYEKNLEIYKQRRQRYFETLEKQKIIRGRLETIENTLKLIEGMAIGMGAPEEISDKLDLLLTNVQDAENFMGDLDRTIPRAKVVIGQGGLTSVQSEIPIARPAQTTQEASPKPQRQGQKEG